MNEFRFANEDWNQALWLVLLLGVLLLALEYRSHRVLERFLSADMQRRLVQRPSRARRVARLVVVCAALVCLVLAMMRPQWGMRVEEATRVDSQIMVCLDVSKSMLAEDVVPSRLERAKAEIDSLLSLIDGGEQVGLLAFAGKASVLCPMTTDFGFLRLILRETGPTSVGLGGTKIGEAIQKAVDGFRSPGDVNRLIILITDGEDHESFPIDAALAAKEKGIRIVSIGFGDEAGTRIEITNPQTGVRNFVVDQSGTPVLSRLDGETLREIALETDGAYIPAGTGALDLDSIYDAHIASLLKGDATAAEQRIVRNEAYQWFVLAGLILWLLSFALIRHAVPIDNAEIGSEFFRSRTHQASGASETNQARASSPAEFDSAHFPTTATVLFLAALIAVASHPQSVCAALATVAFQDNAATLPENSIQATLPELEQGPSPETGDFNRQSGDDLATEVELNLTPRERFNAALAVLRSDPDAAEELLDRARRDAGIDGELRYRAAYNLGWVDIVRSDDMLESEPEQALKHLQLAASRFREAVRLRPESEAARQNLEILGRRILELTDQLNRQEEGELAERLDQLISAIRSQQIQVQSAVEAASSDQRDAERLRTITRELGVVQRQIVADAERLASRTAQGLTALQSNDAGELTPEKQLEIAQQTAAVAELNACINWMTKARSQTRRRQMQRAFVRWSAGLNAAKRARNELRNPIERLSIIIFDTQLLTRQTGQKAAANRNSLDIGDPSNTNRVSPPTWLSKDYLVDLQADVTLRLKRLLDILQAAVAEDAAPVNPSAPTAEANAQNGPQISRLRESIAAALPELDHAAEAFAAATTAVADERYSVGYQSQLRAMEHLQSAAEFFFDYRRLIEVMYGDEQLLGDSLSQAEQRTTSKNTGVAFDEASVTPKLLFEALRQKQLQNLTRSERLEGLLADELEQLEKSASMPAQSADILPADEPSAADQPVNAGVVDPQAEMAKFRNALDLLNSARSQMLAAEKQLTATSEGPASTAADESETAPVEDDNADDKQADTTSVEGGDETASERAAEKVDEKLVETLNRAIEHVDLATQRLDQLRRLFFTLVERLRDTTQRQAALNDDTFLQLTLPADAAPTAESTGPLVERQSELESLASQLAQELQQQAEAQTEATLAEVPTPNAPQANEADQAAAVEAASSLQTAADFTQAARDAMEQAVGSLSELAKNTEPAETKLPHEPTVDAAQVEAGTQTADEMATRSENKADLRGNTSTQQQLALQKLLEALAALDDPQQSSEQEEQDQSQQNQQEQQQPASPQPADPQQPSMSAEQMLQAIREREAERRREKQREQTVIGSTGVEKDW